MKWLHALAARLGFVIKKRRPGVRRSVGDQVAVDVAVDVAHLMEAVHGRDIYAGFDYQALSFDPAGWGSQSSAFASLIAELRPRLIIEVGTWKGGSALHMADLLEKQGSTAKLLCIDTWLGALEFWSDQSDAERFQSLECRHGYPSVYYRFLANVCHAGHQARIVPFPLPSSTAALWLLRTNVRAEMIYIDGSHEEEDVYQDLLDYQRLVAPGGVLLGDDWAWTGVRHAVERFAREEGLTIEHREDKWLLRLPTS